MAKARTELIHCDNCGEDYAATYRRCPFCDAKPGQRLAYAEEPDYEEPYDDEDYGRPRGGKRLAGGLPGGGRGPEFWVRVGLYALSAIVILAAIWILCARVFPKLFPARDADPSPSPIPSEAVSPSPVPSPTLPPVQVPGVVDDDPLGLDNPDLPAVEPDPIASREPLPSITPSAAPSPAPSPTVAVTASPAPAAALKLSNLDFTLSPKYPSYQMEIEGVGRSQATYSIANENVATVSSTGLITAVANGNTKLTVTDKNGNSATAIVRVSGMSAQASGSSASQTPSSPAPSQSAAPAGNAQLNYTDFSISATYPDPVRLRVKNGEAASWSTSDGGVATVSDNGTVIGVGNGSAKITCTLTDGSKLTCTVYVSGK